MKRSIVVFGMMLSLALSPLIHATISDGLTNINTVFIIILENHNWSGIAGQPAECPFINNVLIPQAALATDYQTPPGLHPSEPNYVWLESGTNFGILDDYSSNRIDSTNHLVSLLDRAGISWRAYYDGISAGDYPIGNQYPYVVRHNPQILFNDINSRTNYCAAHMRPMVELSRDLTNQLVARYNFIIPGMTNDMHDLGPGYTSKRTEGDHWLSTVVPGILASEAFRKMGALFITWDEGDEDVPNYSDGPIGMMVLSPLSKGHAYASAISYTHSSTLRTFQEIFNVRPFLGDAANATDLADLFVFPTISAARSVPPGAVDITIQGVIPGRMIVLEQAGANFSWTNIKSKLADSTTMNFSVICGNSPCFFRAAMLP